MTTLAEDKTEEKNENIAKKILQMPEKIMVKDLAEKMEIKSTELISELIKNRIFANINEYLDFDTAEIIADHFEFTLEKSESIAEKRKLERKRYTGAGTKKRPPVVVIMGHVDHGKTTLLDKILETNVASGESGGITQNFSAYQVKKKGEIITFIDTPGHEAFYSMRERGAYITDLAVIVVAADDGVKPQTKEAIKFAKESGVPIIVAINKIDKTEKNIEKVKKELAENDVAPEDWGGKTVCVNISAKTGEGIDELLDMIILTADVEEIKADPSSSAEGFIIESHMDSQIGPVSIVLIQNGTLEEGDYISAGSIWGRIKRIEDFSGKRIHKATPSMPVTVLGLNDIPRVGSFLLEESGRLSAETRVKEFNRIQPLDGPSDKVLSTAKIKELVKSHKVKKLNIVLKADTKGSLEAITQILETIESDAVAVQILKMGVGNITETDVKMCHSSGSEIIGFNVNASPVLEKFAEKEKVEIKIYKVIYELIDEIKEDLTLILEPEEVRTDLGVGKVIAIFKSGKKSAKKVDMIVGVKMESGKTERGSFIEVIRDEEMIGKGNIKELQANKKVVKEVKKGNDAGITYEGDVIIEDGDVLHFYKKELIKRKL